ncbi:MAG TPA: TonB-dependent receptor [Gemmatimonadales bacterium]|nr:TonB-dependent receptor [Gemmatimonadales bacterium]
MSTQRGWLAVTGVALGVLASPLAAQSGNSGILEGRVQAEAGVALPLAEVLAAHTDGFARRQAVSDARGSFRLAFLPPGAYRLTIRRIGYRPVIVNDVVIRAGRVETVLITLSTTALQLDSLVVQAPAVHIGTGDTEFGSRLTAKDLALLPLPNDAKALVGFTPGARPDQVWGAATAQANNYQLDGVAVNHPGVGGDFLQPSTSWIEEIEVRGLGAGAEYGNFQGGVVNIVTKSGSNRFQGALRTNGESWHLNSTNLRVTELGSELSHRGEVDAQFRGPVVRNKLFFAVFGQLVDRGIRVLNKVRQVPGEFSPSEPAEQERKFLAKLTWQPAAKDILNGSLGRIDADGSRFGQNGFQSPEATLDRTARTMFYNVSWQRTLSTRSFLEAKVAGFNGNETRSGYSGIEVPGIATLLEVNPRQYQNAAFRELRKPFSIAFSANWDVYLRIAGMEHHLKAGGEHAFGEWTYQLLRNGGLTWRPGERLTPPVFDPAVPSTWVFNQVITSSWGGEADLGSKVQNSAGFVQDYIQVTRWLSINPGVRWGRWIGRLRQPGGRGFFTPVSDNAFEPRIGVVADLSGRGTLVAKAHWGIFHQNMFASFFDRAEGGSVYSNEERWEYTGPAFTDPRTTFTEAQRNGDPAWRKAQTIRLNEVGRVEDFKEPYIEQAILGLEKTWGSHIKTEALYVRRRNRNMVAVVDRNIANNYTTYHDVKVLDRFFAPQFFGGKPLILPTLYVSNEDIIYWRTQVLEHGLLGDFTPPGFEGAAGSARWAALTYQPDNVLTNVPGATRKFDQLQLSASTIHPSWWVRASGTFTSLKGNLNSLTGTDDYTVSGAGPFVHLNEQLNSYGNLNNQSVVELKLAAGGNLPYRFRGGTFVTYYSGDRVTPTLTISDLLLEFDLPNADSVGPDLNGPRRAPRIRGYFFASTVGQRIFVQPRGTYNYPGRLTVDFHLERGFPVGTTELSFALDAFNALGDNTISEIQTSVNGNLDPEAYSAYGQTRQRVPPRTLRIGAGVKF